MDFEPDDGPTARPWEILALAACEPLRGRPGFHVAPQLTSQVVTGALASYLRPEPDEMLLAVVDASNGTRPAGGCALTTRRVCWSARADEAGEPESGSAPVHAGTAFTSEAARWGRSAAIETVPDPVLLTGEGPCLDLGSGRRLALRGFERTALGAFGGVLTTLRRARATGDLAGSAPPGDVAVARAVMPAVLRQNAAIHRGVGEVLGFHAAALAATPSILVTRGLILACVLVFVAMVADGVPPMAPDAASLFSWGGNLGVALALDGQFWRTLTATFLHGGLIHLGINMWCLSRIGPLVERLYGHVGFALLYLAAGLGGFLVSAWMNPLVVSVGASGAIFGVIGGLGAFLLVHRAAIPASVLRPMRGGVMSFIAYNILFGAMIPGIDNAAHLGGLASGFLAGLLLQRPWPVPRAHAGWPRQLLGGALAAAALAGLGAVVVAQIRVAPEVVAAVGQLRKDADRARQPDVSPEAERERHRHAEAATAYNALAGTLTPVLRRYSGVNDALDELHPRLGDPGAEGWRIPSALEALLAECEVNRAELASIRAEDPSLRAIRECYEKAVDAQADAILALRHALRDSRARARPVDVEAYSRHRVGSVQAVVEAARLRREFIDGHGLVEAPGDPPPTGG